jgi:hypothetical protein
LVVAAISSASVGASLLPTSPSCDDHQGNAQGGRGREREQERTVQQPAHLELLGHQVHQLPLVALPLEQALHRVPQRLERHSNRVRRLVRPVQDLFQVLMRCASRSAIFSVDSECA